MKGNEALSVKKNKMENLKRPYPHFKFPFEIEILVKKMSDEDCKWFHAPTGSYMLNTTNYGWFPTEVLMGVIDKKFTDTHKIGANIGANIGTASITVVNVNKAINMLSLKGYKIINHIENQ